MPLTFTTDAARAAERIFRKLPALRASPAVGLDLPDPLSLRLAARARTEIPGPAWSHTRETRRRSAWLRSAVAALGIESAYFVSLGDKGSPWWRVEPQEPLHWLESLVCSRDDEAPGGHRASPIRSGADRGLQDLTLLSLDGQRALLLFSEGIDAICSCHLPTRVLLHRAQSGLRLLELAEDLDAESRTSPATPWERLDLRLNPRVSGFQQPAPCPCVPAEAVLHAPQCLRRWRCEPGDDVEGFFARVLADVPGWPHERPYSLAIGAFGPLAWTWVGVRSPRWIYELWRRGSLDRLFLFCTAEAEGDLLLGFLAHEGSVEAFLCPDDEVRMA